MVRNDCLECPVRLAHVSDTNSSRDVVDHDAIEGCVMKLGFPLNARRPLGTRRKSLHYYEAIDLETARKAQVILAYEMNGAPLPIEHGAPLRLRVEPRGLARRRAQLQHV